MALSCALMCQTEQERRESFSGCKSLNAVLKVGMGRYFEEPLAVSSVCLEYLQGQLENNFRCVLVPDWRKPFILELNILYFCLYFPM